MRRSRGCRDDRDAEHAGLARQFGESLVLGLETVRPVVQSPIGPAMGPRTTDRERAVPCDGFLFAWNHQVRRGRAGVHDPDATIFGLSGNPSDAVVAPGTAIVMWVRAVA